jgi:hypothetical protein
MVGSGGVRHNCDGEGVNFGAEQYWYSIIQWLTVKQEAYIPHLTSTSSIDLIKFSQDIIMY